MTRFRDTHDSYVKNRFYSYTNIPNENGCMLWIGCKRSWGYGAFSLYKGKSIKAHRYSYHLFTGINPEGKHVLHTCDVPACVAPNHLYLGTDKDNARDRINRGRDSKPPIRFGEKNNKSKLKNTDIIQIIDLIKHGFSDYRIAIMYEVNKRLILLIKQEKIWKNLTVGKIQLADRVYKSSNIKGVQK